MGALDLNTGKLGYFNLSRDDVKALVKCGLKPAPWHAPQQSGVALVRHYHGDHQEGRFRETASLVNLPPDLLAEGPQLRRYFEKTLAFVGNSEPGMWDSLEKRAVHENAVEGAAMSTTGWFSARDVRAALGLVRTVPLSRILGTLVLEGHLVTNGKKRRWCRYMVAMPAGVPRADWAG